MTLTDAAAKHFLQELGRTLPERPEAILIVSAHWETPEPTVNVVAVNATIHDFSGFPRALYKIVYPAPGSATLARRVGDLLTSAGLPLHTDRQRGLDHGAWVPLMLMFPGHDIPVVQLSLQSHLGPEHHFALGRALSPLRTEGVLVIGSGSITHDLSEIRVDGDALPGSEPVWVKSFADWFDKALLDGRTADLLDYRRIAPFAVRNHPTEEHLLPLYVALGAAGDDAFIERLHASVTHGVLRMDVYAFATTSYARRTTRGDHGLPAEGQVSTAAGDRP